MFLDENMVHERRSLPWMVMRSSMVVVHGRTIMRSSMDDDQKSMDDRTIQWTDERATLGKLRHFGAVNKPMIIALDSSST